MNAYLTYSMMEVGQKYAMALQTKSSDTLLSLNRVIGKKVVPLNKASSIEARLTYSTCLRVKAETNLIHYNPSTSRITNQS
jgi:hypothetical protein